MISSPKNVRYVVVTALALVAATCVAVDAVPKTQPTPVDSKSTAKQLGRAASVDLNMPTRYEFKDAKLHDVLGKLSADDHIGIWLLTPTLADAGITDAFPITAKSGDGRSLENALDDILHPTLTWDVYDDLIFVRTPDLDCYPPRETRVYKLLRPAKIDGLIDKIATDIRPETWDRVGGRGSIAPWAGRALIVSQTPRILRSIEKSFAGSLLRVDSFGVRPIRQQSKPDAALLAKLEETVDCDIDNARTRDVLKYLSAHHKLPIRIDGGALKSAGIKSLGTITAQLHGVRVRSVLDEIGKMCDLIWFVDPNGVQLTAEDNHLSSVTYDVRDLLAMVEKPDASEDIIKDWVSAPSWDSNGGQATITLAAGGKLVVRNTRGAHQKIERLLDALRVASRER